MMAEEPAMDFDNGAGPGFGAAGEDNLSMPLGNFMDFLESAPADDGEDEGMMAEEPAMDFDNGAGPGFGGAGEDSLSMPLGNFMDFLESAPADDGEDDQPEANEEVPVDAAGFEDEFGRHEDFLKDVGLWSYYAHIDPPQYQLEPMMEQGDETFDSSDDLSGNSWTNNHDDQPLLNDTLNHINAVEEANASPYEVLSESSYLGEQVYFDQTQINAENQLESMGPQINTYMPSNKLPEQSGLSEDKSEDTGAIFDSTGDSDLSILSSHRAAGHLLPLQGKLSNFQQSLSANPIVPRFGGLPHKINDERMTLRLELQEEEERHQPPTSSTQPRAGSIGGGELLSRPKSAPAACETRELEEEASRRGPAAAGQGGWPLCSGAPRGGKSTAPGPLGRARGAGHGWSSPASPGWPGIGQRCLRKPRSSAVVADSQYVLCVIESLKTKVAADHFTYRKERIEENRSKLSTVTRKTSNTSKVWERNTSEGTDLASNLLTSRQDDALCSMHSLGVSPAEEDGVRSAKLPEVLKHPRYTTWTFLHRNQQMAEDQSVFGSQKIYHDPNCVEALVWKDEEGKNEFRGFEDYIIRMTIEECGESNAVLETLAQHINRAADDIKARYEILHGEKTEGSFKEMSKLNAKVEDVYCDKDLDAALDSFDNLFCRRCLVFDCRLHGCSQDSVFPAEKQSPWNSMDDDDVPCGTHCYKLAPKLDSTTTIDPHMTIDTEPTRLYDNTRKQLASNKKKQGSSGMNAGSQQRENSSTRRVVSESNDSEVHPTSNKSPQQISPKVTIKKMTKSGGCPWPRKLRSRTLNGHKDSVASSQQTYPSTRSTQKKGAPQMEKNAALAEDHNDSTDGTNIEHSARYAHDSSRKEESADGNIGRQEDNGRSWKVIEQGLLVKGLEIFGRNSCLIARNLLGGMKTCSDVFQYMNYTENSSASGVLNGVDSLANGYIEGHELRVRSRFFRRRGKVRRLKHTSKSAGYHFIRKRIAGSNDKLYQQYNPCGCQSACGKECPCLKNGTSCEKYCGCPKMCRNRFRGCHCTKTQCRNGQCPCFASDRECDPDVCKNCWVGCGDGSGTLGFPKKRGGSYDCRNMKVLLKQQQRILLGRSDVSGWGAFLKNAVGEGEYIGEYTGEVISHQEADKRENSSFLFDLNKEFVLDARRMGNKLKFANHSIDPNCHAKIMFVAGDHRVGIFAKERIGVGEEIFYDYHYKPNATPAWALKPDAPGAKDPGQPSSARAKKPDAPGAEDPGQPSCARAKKPAH